MPAMPRDKPGDHTFALLADPYRYIGRRCRDFGADLFETRFLLQRTICMTGPQAAELFYRSGHFQRAGAAPRALRATLFGNGAVQGLDGEAHRVRKALFLHVTAPARVSALCDAVEQQWLLAARLWAEADSVPLYASLHPLLTRAVCGWAGVPLPDDEVSPRTAQLVALFDQAGAPGLGHFRSRRARHRIEGWLAQVIDRIRAGRIQVSEETAAHRVAWHRDDDGRLLSPRIAAVELANVLRPTVAVSVYIVFVAHALHQYPDCLARAREGDTTFVGAFVEEVRRWYPFFPAVVARVRAPFEWNGYAFPGGLRVLLDLYGTNHDPRSWSDPDAFMPERFLGRICTPFDFVPQGGADVAGQHRCPGEGITVALMKQAVDFLANRLRFAVPEQDLSIDYGRLPALPRDRMVLRDVRLMV